MQKEEIFAIDKEHYLPVFNRYPIVLEYGEGPYVFDSEGKRYLDFLAGIAVNALGHGHPKLAGAIAEQAKKLIHCSNLYYTQAQATLIEKLADISGLDKVFLANSGAEANDGAIKLARKYGKKISNEKFEIITAVHSFHGRTLATLTATGQPKYQEGFEPLPQGFGYIPFNDIRALREAVSAKTCAVLLEPIQGEGGVYVPSPEYLQQAREICDANGALLIFDEIQTGMGRTGKMFAYQHYNILPDMVTLAKGLGGGVPIGAILVNNKIAAAIQPGDHGSTFGGNPLACAAANAVLTVLEEEQLVANAKAIGEYMVDAFSYLQKKYPSVISIVRGKGLMCGMELTRPGRDIVAECLQSGVIINCTAGNVLRFVPPLIINSSHVDELVAVLDKVLGSLE